MVFESYDYEKKMSSLVSLQQSSTSTDLVEIRLGGRGLGGKNNQVIGMFWTIFTAVKVVHNIPFSSIDYEKFVKSHLGTKSITSTDLVERDLVGRLGGYKTPSPRNVVDHFHSCENGPEHSIFTH